jgi:hypothetical protein
MRLILEYDIRDTCAHYTKTIPIIYESAEALAIDFEDKCEEFYGKYPYHFSIGGVSITTFDFFHNGKYMAPIIFTVDEWFSQIESQSNDEVI